MPLELEIVAEGEAVEEWKELMDRHHELGYRHPFGCFLRYLLRGIVGVASWAVCCLRRELWWSTTGGLLCL